MAFTDRITRLPLAFDAEIGRETADALPWAKSDLRALISGMAGCSPYLSALARKQAAWLEEVLQGDPEAAIADVLTGLAPGSIAQVTVDLRQAKQKVALLVALADLGGVWGLDEVTGALTGLADRALDTALKTALLPALTLGKLPGQSEDAVADAAGLVSLAMGKMGAFELNYSSDIDIICLFDNRRFETDDLATVRAVYVKAVRRAMGLLSDLTGDGYVFRTDLRLRPDPSVTQVAVSVSAAEQYYEALGRTWERAAFVKARPAAGAIEVGEQFLKDIRPFIWRRHLDFATVQDTQDILQKIRAQNGHFDANALAGRNVKLCQGGIREIEFFTQTRQLIAGGRDPSLRVRGTREGLQRLAEKGWIRNGDSEVLDRDYLRLREIEHRAQMVQDAQTHHLPVSDDGWRRMAMFTGTDDVAGFQAELRQIFDRVHGLTDHFFAPSRSLSPEPDMSERTRDLVAQWRTYPALRSSRAQGIFDRLLPRLLAGFDRAANKDEALVQFDGFLKGMPSGVQLFTLFEANPQLIDLMVDISSTAPALARYLSMQMGVLDAVIGGAFFENWPGLQALNAELAVRLSDGDLDYERQLDTARYWMKDWHFRIGVHHLRGLIGPEQAAAEYSDLAQATVAGIWAASCAEFSRKHGPLPGRGAVVLGMGSLGARQVNAGSDLDLIVIYDAATDEESQGRKPLPARTYYARLTRTFITGLSVKTSAGSLYEVDMRLRPSGRQGPAATSWSGFQSYQHTEAWTWEHLALTRARVIAGDPGLAAEMEAFRQELLSLPREPSMVCRDLSDMRDRLAAAKPRRSAWDIGNGPGGLQDIELLAEAMALLSGSTERAVRDQLALEALDVSPAERSALLSAHTLLSAVKLVARLLTEQPLNPEAVGHGGRDLLLRDAGEPDIDHLESMLRSQMERAGDIIDTILRRAIGSPDPHDSDPSETPADKK